MTRRREVDRLHVAGILGGAFMFVFAFLVDGWHGLSLTRMMAIYVILWTMNIAHDATLITGNDVIVIVFCLAAAFGKGVFEFALMRWRGSVASTDTTVNVKVDETIRKEVAERRDAGKEFGVEPTP